MFDLKKIFSKLADFIYNFTCLFVCVLRSTKMIASRITERLDSVLKNLTYFWNVNQIKKPNEL